MEIKTLTPALSTGDQISAADVQRLPSLGFRSILCNRPDGESGDQPRFAEIAAAAAAAGIEARHVPVVAGWITDADAAAFARALAALPKPVFAYCRSGMRSETLWSLSGGALARSEA